MVVASGPLDVEPLTESLTRAQVKAFRQSPRSLDLVRLAALMGNHRGGIAARAISGALISLLVTAILVTAAPFFAPNVSILLFVSAALSLLPLKWCWDTFRYDVVVGNVWARWYRLTRFAAQNRLGYSEVVATPAYAGSIFRRGTWRIATDVVTFSRPTAIQMGNYRYEGEVELGRVHEWGFIRIELDRRLPHMMLEAKDRHPLTGTKFPVAFTDEVILSLEGDFDEHFTLHVPTDYERDALYVFTPDLMALLIDEAAAFDVEIVDSAMYIYSHRPFAMATAEAFSFLEHIMTTVGSKARSQSARYWDDRVGSNNLNVIAPRGRRMRVRVSLIYMIGMVVILGGTATVLISEALVRR
jgi:hypothetical protein